MKSLLLQDPRTYYFPNDDSERKSFRSNFWDFWPSSRKHQLLAGDCQLIAAEKHLDFAGGYIHPRARLFSGNSRFCRFEVAKCKRIMANTFVVVALLPWRAVQTDVRRVGSNIQECFRKFSLKSSALFPQSYGDILLKHHVDCLNVTQMYSTVIHWLPMPEPTCKTRKSKSLYEVLPSQMRILGRPLRWGEENRMLQQYRDNWAKRYVEAKSPSIYYYYHRNKPMTGWFVPLDGYRGYRDHKVTPRLCPTTESSDAFELSMTQMKKNITHCF